MQISNLLQPLFFAKTDKYCRQTPEIMLLCVLVTRFCEKMMYSEAFVAMLIKKTVSLILCFVLLAASFAAFVPGSVLNTSAAVYRKGANSAHSSYTGSRYYTNFQKIALTGDGRTDVVAVALSQIGYLESPTAYDFDGIGGGSGNYTEYNYNMGDFGVGYGGSNYAWCASFVSWALFQSRCSNLDSMYDWARYAIGNPEYIWREVGCVAWANQLRSCGYFQRSKAYNGNTYIPRSGDLIFFCWEGPNGGEDHIGLVVYSDGSYVYTVEGNTSGRAGLESNGGGVYFKRYSLDYSCITGYGVLPYETVSTVPSLDYSGSNPTTGLYVTSTANKAIYSSANDTTCDYYAELGTVFEVVGIADNGRLKVKGILTTTGETVNGYILNDNNRAIQISSYEYEILPAELLDEAIANARGVRYDHYSEEALEFLRSIFDEAVALRNSGTASDSELVAMAEKLQNALDSDIFNNETVVSKVKPYTVRKSERTDGWADDGKKMTDGLKGSIDGESESFSGWGEGKAVEIVIDLGENAASDTYRIYTAACSDWGISKPAEFSVAVSEDGESFNPVASTDVRSITYNSDKWQMYIMTVRSEEVRNERYIKFTITPNGNHIWLEEAEASVSGVAASGRGYISAFNKRIESGETVIFTPDAGEITVEKYNHAYTTNVIAVWDADENCYTVTSVTEGSGAGTTPSVKLSENEILICAHEWEKGVDDSVIGSYANVQVLKNARKGDKLLFTGVDIANKMLGAAAEVEVYRPFLIGDVNEDGSIDTYDYLLVKRYYFNTIDFTYTQFGAADVNSDGLVDTYDCLLIKRHYFGTYFI